jgi:hypothetical protein
MPIVNKKRVNYEIARQKKSSQFLGNKIHSPAENFTENTLNHWLLIQLAHFFVSFFRWY